ncbi:FixH family protein [Acidovorax facilis]|uniref:FixH family protein n=1 Tax=Acidovorax facilis TaxID=12917 RepID=UPI003CEEC3C6
MNRHITTAVSLMALACIPGCMSPPKDLDLALTRTTLNQKYVVSLHPPTPLAAINQLHSWHLTLKSAAGIPVTRARIVVDGGMPQHGHGLPTRPQVTKEVSEGHYLIEGMKFSMTGWWEINIAIEGAAGSDRATLNMVIPESGVSR